MNRLALAACGAVLASGLMACSSHAKSSAPPAGRALPGQSVGTSADSASSGGTSGGSCQPDVTPQICVTAAITGAMSISGTSQTTAPVPPDATPDTKCAQLATLSRDGERDLGGNILSLADHKMVWDEDLSHFTGPGTYDLSHSEFYVSVDDHSFMADQSSASVVVRPDFSVMYTFTGLHSDSGTISGSLSWTCVDPQ